MGTKATARPPSIETYEAEARYTDPDLDYEYIDAAAQDIARSLRSGRPAEVAYQPGDGTFYGLVFVTLTDLVRARPRFVEGRPWDACAVRGMLGSILDPMLADEDAVVELNLRKYVTNGYLVSWVEHGCYPLRLGDGRGTLASDYVGEHFQTSETSAASLAILFRAISWHLDASPAHLQAVV